MLIFQRSFWPFPFLKLPAKNGSADLRPKMKHFVYFPIFSTGSQKGLFTEYFQFHEYLGTQWMFIWASFVIINWDYLFDVICLRILHRFWTRIDGRGPGALSVAVWKILQLGTNSRITPCYPVAAAANLQAAASAAGLSQIWVSESLSFCDVHRLF